MRWRRRVRHEEKRAAGQEEEQKRKGRRTGRPPIPTGLVRQMAEGAASQGGAAVVPVTRYPLLYIETPMPLLEEGSSQRVQLLLAPSSLV